MNLYNLKIFADMARFQSMTKASELNHVSRPAVSQAIKKLEDDLGVELLFHKRRTIELTDAGWLLFKRSEHLLSEAEEISLMLKQGCGPIVRDFKIGSSRTLATFNLSQVLVKMNEEYPEVSIQVYMANSAALAEKLENREIDIAFMIGDDNARHAIQTVIGKGHFVLVRPASQRNDQVKFAITERRPETERLRVLFERQFGRPLPVLAEIHSWDAIWQGITSGLYGGLVPDFLLTSRLHRAKENYSVMIPKVFPYEIKAVHLKSRTSDPLVKSFVTGCKAVNGNMRK
jgi:LysR family carnitine catabolism transcriptional activator